MNEQQEHPPCTNPNCKSYGHWHPHCKCYAEGGQVCAGPHSIACNYYADGGEVEENEAMQDPAMVVDHAAASTGLLKLLKHTGTEHDLLHDAKKGMRKVESHASRFFDKTDPMDVVQVQPLHEHLEDMKSRPDKAFEIGQNTTQMHAAMLGAKAAAATQYMASIKPVPMQLSPLDTRPNIDKMEQAKYDRQLAIAQNPSLVLQHAKNGTIQPQDMTTLSTLYPRLVATMQQKVIDALAKLHGKMPTYRQKQGLSMLLGQPLDTTMTPKAMQAIIASQGPQQATQQSAAAPSTKGPTSEEIKAVEKDDKLYETSLESRLINKNDK